ncbi:MAG: hypothetical protein EBV41_04615 [Actinobacteria bacterium]|nr:hypothetical protein [Actinomycetota bacterium]
MLTMSMTLDQPTPSAAGAADQPLLAGDYAKLDFTAPATVGVVLYESQRLGNFLQGEIHRSEKSIRGDMAAMEKSLRADMAAMEKSLRAEMAANTRLLLTVMVSPHGITLAAVAAMVRFW